MDNRPLWVLEERICNPLGLTIRQIWLPGFRKRKHTHKEKPRPVGTSDFLLPGPPENPNLPVPVSVRLAGGRPRGKGIMRRENVPDSPRCLAWKLALKAKKLVRGSSVILCTPGKRKDLGDCVVCSLLVLLLCPSL